MNEWGRESGHDCFCSWFSSHRHKRLKVTARWDFAFKEPCSCRTPGSLYLQWQTSPLQVLIGNEQRGAWSHLPLQIPSGCLGQGYKELSQTHGDAMSGQLWAELFINNKAPGFSIVSRSSGRAQRWHCRDWLSPVVWGMWWICVLL